MNSYRTSDGQKVKKSVIDRRIRMAKDRKLQLQRDEHGYNFCEECGKNAMDTYLDCSHDVSVDECQKSGQADKTWDIENITIRCRKCHQVKDKLNLQFNDSQASNI